MCPVINKIILPNMVLMLESYQTYHFFNNLWTLPLISSGNLFFASLQDSRCLRKSHISYSLSISMKPMEALTIMTREMKETFDSKILRSFISLLVQPRSPPLKQVIDNTSIRVKPVYNRVIFFKLSIFVNMENGYKFGFPHRIC